MHASNHSPRVNRPWPVSFTVTSAGKPVKAEVLYEVVKYVMGDDGTTSSAHAAATSGR